MGSIEDKLKTHIVYGNGESRPREPLSGNFTSWGCNAIYRDFVVDNLVVIYYPMQQEVYESDYPLTHKCWFSDWELLPEGFDPQMVLIMNDGPVYETSKKDRKSCVVQGKTKETVESNLKEMLLSGLNVIPNNETSVSVPKSLTNELLESSNLIENFCNTSLVPLRITKYNASSNIAMCCTSPLTFHLNQAFCIRFSIELKYL